MKRIASFSVDHDILQKGMYTSAVYGDVVTYDIRMKEPNKGDYLSNGCMHTFEHLFATYVRNTAHSDKIIYVGPMGCRTGFYFLVRDTLSPAQTIALVRESFDFIAKFEGKVPGTEPKECGNYKEHDLEAAKATAAYMCDVLKSWTPQDLKYKK